MSLRILVIDDHPLMRDALADRLAAALPEATIERAAHPDEAWRRLSGEPVELVVADVMYADRPLGFELGGRLAGLADPPALLFISSYELPGFVARALDLGAAGYLAKTANAGELAQAVRTVIAGGSAYSQRLLRAARPVRGRLRERERRVIERIAQGATNKAIAHELGVAEKTVESLVSRLFALLEADSRSELVAKAIRDGEITVAPGG